MKNLLVYIFTESKRLRLAEHPARMAEMKNVFRFSVGKPDHRWK
jgi:hypothetical protein